MTDARGPGAGSAAFASGSKAMGSQEASGEERDGEERGTGASGGDRVEDGTNAGAEPLRTTGLLVFARWTDDCASVTAG